MANGALMPNECVHCIAWPLRCIECEIKWLQYCIARNERDLFADRAKLAALIEEQKCKQ